MASSEPVSGTLIRDLPLLARLDDSDTKALAALGRVRTFTPGSVIFHEGDAGDALYVVMEGNVRISMLSGAGDEMTVAQFGPGDCFGELSMLDGRPRSATAAAATRTRTFVVTRDAFRTWLSGRPAAAAALLETLSLRLRRADSTLSDFIFLDLAHRLSRKLVSLAADAGGTPGTDVRLTITQAELGTMLGASRESVNKQLNQFAREGWLTLSRGSVTLRDIEALRTFA